MRLVSVPPVLPKMLPRYRLRWNTRTSGSTEKMTVSASTGKMNAYAVPQ